MTKRQRGRQKGPLPIGYKARNAVEIALHDLGVAQAALYRATRRTSVLQGAIDRANDDMALAVAADIHGEMERALQSVKAAGLRLNAALSGRYLGDGETPQEYIR